MSRGIYLTGAERNKVASLASEVVRQRCRDEGAFLGAIVADYVGEAELARDAVVERCKNDREHRDAVVNHYLSGCSPATQLELLKQTLGVSVTAARLGFNPFDPEREAGHHRSRRFINSRRQVAVLLLGLLVFAVMGLFPPWLKRDWRTQWAFFFPASHVVSSEFIGYHFAFAEMPGPASFSSWSNQSEHTTYNWHVGLLLLQWAVWALLIAISCVALRDRRTFEEQVAELQTEAACLPSPIVHCPGTGADRSHEERFRAITPPPA